MRERLEVLQMIADGVVTPEEGERLLAALEGGTDRARTSSIEEMGRGFVGVGRGFAGMGRTIAITVDQAVRNALQGKTGEADWPSDPDADFSEGTVLEIVNSAMGDGSIFIAGGADRGAILGRARIRREANRVRIEWPGDDLHVDVPAHVEEVRASAYQGDVRVRGLEAELHVRTLRGDLELLDLRRPFDAQTVRGDVLLEIDAVAGVSRAGTVKGAVEALLGPAFTGRLAMRCLGGDIVWPEDLGQVVSPPVGRMPRSAVLSVGDDPGRANVVLEAAKGGIRVRRSG